MNAGAGFHRAKKDAEAGTSRFVLPENAGFKVGLVKPRVWGKMHILFEGHNKFLRLRKNATLRRNPAARGAY